ncbi:class II glutamine amidotransferase [Streptomyces acidiscabies]|uniref:glutamine--fructose-6-phosphate transaminase (isomerizing) n=1 Tax=Streptomyces acidiscabies TaxID=42234 RepID=A0AAP6BDJ3_9ACTN|nr:glutamine amidotransferase family protein [Streptomyces acidiscabies]MBP5934645.1 glutamine amidotransferase [Streptomyces sp. LBUM 1476]MBZ3917635.1 glutamine amidotransferase family protein [Streptomyces acidiscabies]MDX2962678.1 glutamine amidotransferase family protein [Streptomyces acidiscabies]MDX3019015.1 glutamine amidotransferase family protein [Streptomyces acidiscabies]MDX3790313.1 glutamine amidotransferase family protein [Streptomyces acidiscabies]
MCGIVGLHLREPSLEPRLGELLAAMLGQVAERGPDSAGVAIYGDPLLSPPGVVTTSLLGVSPGDVKDSSAVVLGATTLVQTDHFPDATVIGSGEGFAVLKGVGNPVELAETFGLARVTGHQALGHTRMATESAVTPEGAHPFSVGPGQCLVHNGSFANHATIRRELRAQGVEFDSENDSEVGARFIAHQLARGADLEKALKLLCERFDGFYTLLVTTHDSFAVVRDAIACKPALIAETDDWVAMASEYRALDVLPGVEHARIFEPEPEEVYVWRR